MCKWSIIYIHCTYCSYLQKFLIVHYYTHFLLWKMNNHFQVVCIQPHHHYQVTSYQVSLFCCNVQSLPHFHWILDLDIKVWYYSEIFLNRTLSKLNTCLNQTDFTVPSTRCLCNLNLCKPSTCLNWTNSSVPKGFGIRLEL